MDPNTFERIEDDFHAQYDDIEIPFDPVTLIIVELQRYRKISVSRIADFFDTPDPEFHVICPKIEEEHLRKFVTFCLEDNSTEGDIQQTFKFLVPKNIQPDEEFPIIFELFDRNLISDKLIGTSTFDASILETNGEILQKTVIFGKNNGELDVKIRKCIITTPDFRYSLGLCSEERKFRKKRIPVVFQAMKNILGEQNGPSKVEETPVVSLVCSGGGYRAVTGMCGAMEAMRDAGLMDVITYNSALSGSAWYFTAAYGLKGLSAETQEACHNTIREGFSKSLLLDMVNPLTIHEYKKYVDNELNRFGIPHSFANFFPGFLVGRQLLAKKMEERLDNLNPYVSSGKVPFPLLIAIHVKDKVRAGEFHAYVERTPCEIYMPSYGIGIDPSFEGSTWSSGIILRRCVRYPLHFTIAMTGCAFSVLLNTFLRYGKEIKSSLWSLADIERIHKKYSTSSTKAADNFINIESEDESDEEDDDSDDQNDVFVSFDFKDAATTYKLNNSVKEKAMEKELDPLEKVGRFISYFTDKSKAASTTTDGPQEDSSSFLLDMIKKNTFFTSRNAVVGRTARLYNCVYGLGGVKRYSLNPLRKLSLDVPNKNVQKIVNENGFNPFQKKISTKTKIHSFIDAGILKNVSTEAVLRPQRTTDVVIVMDFNDYGSDDSFNWEPLLAAAAHAWQSGLKFPEFDAEAIAKLPPKEFLAFPGDGDDTPTVLWFTLSNKMFRSEKNYVPRSQENKTNEDSRKFNDFDVFGKNTFCSTFTFQYSKYNFDQLRELMYYNVTSHVEEIKHALSEATKRKRRKLKNFK